MNERGVSLLELIITLMIIAIVTSISMSARSFKSNKLSLLAEEFVTDFNLYRTLTSETPAVYSISFRGDGYEVIRHQYGREDRVIESRKLPEQVEWLARPEEILFKNDGKLRVLGNKQIMTIELADRRAGRKVEITIVPVSSRVRIARYLDM